MLKTRFSAFWTDDCSHKCALYAQVCTVRSSVHNVVTTGSARLHVRLSVLASELHSYKHA